MFSVSIIIGALLISSVAAVRLEMRRQGIVRKARAGVMEQKRSSG